ncbi:uncharacterized protein zgc:161969 [Gadus chalcogrammus]|uniref:uncharacterized protein zgc:161969 n=1 Tax=Gadus chalcogrammus TaxID=1042646 RepID=UPI0024C36743|nr:uncharacterized protein zgc:161969 [Gadus chalcogrammus]
MDTDHTEPVIDTKTALHSWRYGHHFTHKADQGKNVIVQCNLCLPNVNLLSTSKTSTSNLKKHLDRKHLGCHEVNAPKRGRKKEHNGEATSHFQLKKVKAEIISKTQAQSRLDELIFNFIVEDCQSFHLLEQPGFRKLLDGLTEGQLTMDKLTLSTKVDLEFSSMREVLTAKLDSVLHMCTTGDIWTTGSRSYFGMTCHWIDAVTLERKSAALGFARLEGPNTVEAISGRIRDIHCAYNIESKVQTTLVDNGSPFVGMFKEFLADGDEDDVGFFENVGAILDSEQERDAPVFVPDVGHCASHTLDLIVMEDFWLAVSQGPVGQLYYSTMSKVSAFWSKCHKLQVASAKAEDVAKMPLVVPSASRWNAEYSMVQRLVSLVEKERSVLSERLGVPALQAKEMAFLQEYVVVFKPLAFALELFQAEQKCYLGLVIPTILSLKNKLTEQRATARYFADVIDTVVATIDERFRNVFASTEAKIATATTPQFRLWWMSPSEREEMCGLLEAAELDPGFPVEEATDEYDTITESEDDFFSYGPATPRSRPEKLGAKEEIQKYLEGTGKSLECLKDFPRVRQLFIKYNTTLPSAAPVQRLFSHKANLAAPQRITSLTDNFFERINLLRYNSTVCLLDT